MDSGGGSGTEIGRIFWRLALNDDDYQKGVQGASDSGNQLGSTLQSVANKTAVAMGVAGAALTVLAKQSTDFTVDYVKSVNGLARTTGASVADASRLQYAMNRLGIDTDKAGQVFGIFEKHIAANDDAFKKLGVSSTNADGSQKSFNDILLATADKFAAMPDGITKTATALDVFGKSGKDMIKVLNLGSAGIQQLESDADKFGLTLTAQNAGTISKYIQSQKDLKDTTDSMKIAIGLATAPVLTEFDTKLNDVLQKLLGMDGPMRTVTADVIAFGGPILTGAGALIGFAANIGTVITSIQAMNISMAAFGGFALWAVAIAGIIADLYLIVKAVQTVIGAFDALSNAKAATIANNASNSVVHANLLNLSKNGTPAQKAAANKDLAAGLATGGPAKKGTPYLIGEQGPELFVPNVSGHVVPNKQITGGGGTPTQPHQTNFYGDINIASEVDADAFLNKLGRKTELAQQGLTG